MISSRPNDCPSGQSHAYGSKTGSETDREAPERNDCSPGPERSFFLPSKRNCGRVSTSNISTGFLSPRQAGSPSSTATSETSSGPPFAAPSEHLRSEYSDVFILQFALTVGSESRPYRNRVMERRVGKSSSFYGWAQEGLRLET
jgi:hypothetical protein